MFSKTAKCSGLDFSLPAAKVNRWLAIAVLSQMVPFVYVSTEIIFAPVFLVSK